MPANPVRYDPRGVIAVLAFEHVPRNCLSHPLRSALVDAVDRAESDAAIRAIVLTGSPEAFSAGADVQEFGTPRANAEPTLHTLIEVVERCPKPVIAAIGGFCLGGGLELALACHFRVASPRAQLGLPEIKLGLLPGAGGTQRLPRLLGVEKALNLILSGAPAAAERFAGTPLLDDVVEGDLLAGALSFAEKMLRDSRPAVPVRERKLTIKNADGFFQFARASVASSSKGMPAPGKCVDAVEAAVKKPFSEGLAVERKCFEELLASPESKALRHVFFAERAAAKIPDVPADTPVRPVRRVGIIGAGTMGAGIAMNFLSAGIPVVLLEMKQDPLDRGVATIRRNYEATVKKGRLTSQDYERAMGLLTPTLDFAVMKDADLFIEAVFEDLAVKEQVLRHLDEIAKPGAILATNTSTLNVDRIAAATRRPQDVLGMHFFSPANVMKLLEVVRGAATAKDVLATVMALAKTIKKTAVVSGVCDGFIGNRMLQAYGRQAFFLLDEGALPAQIDRALERFGMAMGPFRVGDLAGLDISWAIRKRLRVERPHIKYSGIPDRLCELGRFGQKVGKGWYRYEAGSREPKVDPEVTQLIETYRTEQRIAARKVGDEEIVLRCGLALVNEGARILEDGIALRASDIDLVYLTGYGFPSTRGGPMFWADGMGVYKAARAMRRFAAQDRASGRGDAEFWTPAPLVERLAAEGRTFSGGQPS
jgi:3-hydroxyacyl-CoA dehydrogenase